jgi:hypothetical protein
MAFSTFFFLHFDTQNIDQLFGQIICSKVEAARPKLHKDGGLYNNIMHL